MLRRAEWLECIARDEATGAPEPNEKILNDILRDIANESAEGCAMIARLVLLRSPLAAALMRQLISSKRDPAEKMMLRQALAHGTEEVLAHMESDGGIADKLGRGAITGAGEEVRRVVTLLRELEDDPGAGRHRIRLKAIREKLDEACLNRFSNGVREVLVAPLEDASVPVDKAGQTHLETGARELRSLETMARTVGSPERYDRMLSQASETVREAIGAGTLTPMRGVRLIEILSGPEEAEVVYATEFAGPGALANP